MPNVHIEINIEVTIAEVHHKLQLALQLQGQVLSL